MAFLTNGLFPWVVGGMQKHSANLIREWARMGVDLDVYFSEGPGYPPPQEGSLQASRLGMASGMVSSPQPSPPEEERGDGGPRGITAAISPPAARGRVRVFGCRPSWLPYFPLHHYADCYVESCRIAERFVMESACVDFIYAQGFTGYKLVRMKRTRLNLPPIGVNLHGMGAIQGCDSGRRDRLLRYVSRPMEKWLLRHTDVALSLGGRLDDVIHSGAPQAKIIRSGNGVAEDWLCDSIQSHIGLMRFIFVGRHTRCKGLHVLYDALRGVQEQFELHLVGDIADRDRLDDARLTYHGQVTDEHRLKTLMRQMDVLLCPSLLEGAPTVVLEGMASGLAIVATDVGATCDLTGSDNGWLIPPNSVEALRNALGEALRLDPSLLEAKKRASLERVKSHLWPRVAEDTLRNIKDFLRQTAVG